LGSNVVRGDTMSRHIHRYAVRPALAFKALVSLVSLLMLPFVANSAPTNKYAVAVIIGNTNYQSRIPSVDFAGNDADAFKKFVIEVQGYDPENIIDLRDATKAQMESAFGNDRSHEGKLWRYLDPKGRSDVTVFYSGHGVPGLKDKRGYLLPVNADAETPEINGFAVDTLLANLGKLKTKSVTVFVDACFSGDSQKGMLVRSTSGITIAPMLPDSSTGMTIITAAQGDQVASWDLKAKHGMFTKHLLDALRGGADKSSYGNGDKKVSLGEVREYLDDRLTRAARREFGRHQNVWAKGDKEHIIVNKLPQKPKETVTSSATPTVNPTPDTEPVLIPALRKIVTPLPKGFETSSEISAIVQHSIWDLHVEHQMTGFSSGEIWGTFTMKNGLIDSSIHGNTSDIRLIGKMDGNDLQLSGTLLDRNYWGASRER
jgi:hypothetical protein